MREKESLTRAEWLMMEALWTKSPMFLSEIMESMKNVVDWKSSSYMTYLKRLTDSGYVAYELRSGNRCYYPLRGREDCVEEESGYILSKMTGDSAKMLLAAMVQKTDIDEAEKESLFEMLNALTMRAKQEEE